MRLFIRPSGIHLMLIFLLVVSLATIDMSRSVTRIDHEQDKLWHEIWSLQLMTPSDATHDPLRPKQIDYLHARSTPQTQIEFVHIPNTADSAIEYVASLTNITWGQCHWKDHHLAGPGCHKPNLAETLGIRWDLGQTPLRHLTALEPPYKNKKLFTVVCNPYERLINEFYSPTVPRGLGAIVVSKITQMMGHVVRTETPEALNDFLVTHLQQIAKSRVQFFPQSAYVYSKEGFLIVDHVLQYEHLHEQFTELMTQYNLPVNLDSEADETENDSRQGLLSVKDLFPETVQLINEIFLQDFRNFGYPMIDPKGLAAQRAREQTVQRIYYINLQKNINRRALMESWLIGQPIPFERIAAKVGDTDPEHCISGKQHPDRCNGILGLAETELDIIRNHNTSGLTLVFEDDFIVHKPLDEIVRKTLRLVPSNWDLIRWDCWGKPLDTFNYVLSPGILDRSRIFRTNGTNLDTTVFSQDFWFCGGTHAMMWREESISKLENIWSRLPFEDIDCKLTTTEPHFNSYCVNLDIGVIKLVQGESTDIPKVNT